MIVTTGLPPGMEFDWEGNPRYQKSWYQVFMATDPNDQWSYDEPRTVLFESDNLGQAHSYAYNEWLKDKRKIYTIIQACDESCRGGYGFAEEE
jgi:hypothetical protein